MMTCRIEKDRKEEVRPGMKSKTTGSEEEVPGESAAWPLNQFCTTVHSFVLKLYNDKNVAKRTIVKDI